MVTRRLSCIEVMDEVDTYLQVLLAAASHVQTHCLMCYRTYQYCIHIVIYNPGSDGFIRAT